MRFSFTVSLALIAIILSHDRAYCQLFHIYDENSNVTISGGGNRIYIRGVAVNSEVPRWEEILGYNSPCAHIELEREWNCGNPGVPGYRSLAYTKELRIIFDDGCAGDLAYWVQGYQKDGVIRVHSDKNYYPEKVEIRDACGTRIKQRQLPWADKIDPNEYIRLFVSLKSQQEGFNFPENVKGIVITCGERDIDIAQSYGEDGRAEYYSGAYPARDFILCGPMVYSPFSFRIDYENSPVYTINYSSTDFNLDSYCFEGNILMNNNGPGLGVCYPWASYLQFGGKIDNRRSDWPSDCGLLDFTLIPYWNNEVLLNSAGIVQTEAFLTSPAKSSYHIDNMGFQVHTVELNPVNFSVNNGPELPLPHGVQTLRVYHGFQAYPVAAIPDLEVNQERNIVAITEPELPIQDRITYEWHIQTIDGGNGHFASSPAKNNWKRFVADVPGRFNISYFVSDYPSSATFSESGTRQVTITVRLNTVINPSERACFNTENNGSLTIHGQSTTRNEILDEDIDWTIEEILGSQLTIDPPDHEGPNITFEYLGLPVENSQFGEKNIAVVLDAYNLHENIPIRMFYHKDASNHPAGEAGTPNWFYYWRQGNIVPQFNTDILYDPVRTDCYGVTIVGVISLTRLASGQFLSEPVCVGPTYCFGGPSVQGIDCTAEVVGHERFHQWIYQQWSTGEWSGYPPPYPDSDEDYLPDIFEIEVTGTLPTDSDTYGMRFHWPNNPDYKKLGDQEYWAMVQGYGMRGIANLDWSHGQYSKQWPE